MTDHAPNPKHNALAIVDIEPPEEIESDGHTVCVGQWYWRENNVDMDDDESETYYDNDLGRSVPMPTRELTCVMEIGSNYAEVKSIRGYSWRHHLDRFDLEYEPNPEAVWSQCIASQQQIIRTTMGEINSLTASIGLQASGVAAIDGSQETAALAQLGSVSADSHKLELARAKEQLPELFKRLERENKQLARYMTAATLPLKAQAGDLKTLVEAIDARVLNIDLYAGLSEEAVQIRGGDPAAYDERLAVRQRMLYMDEECLPFYTAGGMTFKQVDDFDRWLCEGDRFRTILPESRCVVAFRVRRHRREYDGSSGNIGAFIQFWYEAERDIRTTYLYVRNGEQLHRLSTNFQFDARLFPDSAARTIDEDMMFAEGWHASYEVIPRREYEARMMAWKKWKKAKPKRDHWYYDDRDFVNKDWVPFTPDSVFYDDAMRKLKADILHYNRVAIILQGLFDRSLALHPHPPVKTWTPEGFDRAIRLVYDNELALAPPDRPDFAAYWAECNKSLATGSVTFGQQAAWRKQAEEKYGSYKEIPYYLKGPGKVARVAKFHARTGHCTYRWSHESNVYDRYTRSYKVVGHSTKVPAAEVFNLDGYKSGDFRRFYNDPRTRTEYMQWAKFLLTAEDYHAGKVDIAEPFVK